MDLSCGSPTPSRARSAETGSALPSPGQPVPPVTCVHCGPEVHPDSSSARPAVTIPAFFHRGASCAVPHATPSWTLPLPAPDAAPPLPAHFPCTRPRPLPASVRPPPRPPALAAWVGQPRPRGSDFLRCSELSLGDFPRRGPPRAPARYKRKARIGQVRCVVAVCRQVKAGR